MEQIVDYLKSASEVRKEWSSTIDTAIRERPVFIQRTRDNLILLDIATLRLAFRHLRYEPVFSKSWDGKVACTEARLGLSASGEDREECIRRMIGEMRAYAEEYYQNFVLYSRDPAKRDHLPYILKILACADEELME